MFWRNKKQIDIFWVKKKKHLIWSYDNFFVRNKKNIYFDTQLLPSVIHVNKAVQYLILASNSPLASNSFLSESRNHYYYY